MVPRCFLTILFFSFKHKGYIDGEGAIGSLTFLQHLLHGIDECQDGALHSHHITSHHSTTQHITSPHVTAQHNTAQHRQHSGALHGADQLSQTVDQTGILRIDDSKAKTCPADACHVLESIITSIDCYYYHIIYVLVDAIVNVLAEACETLLLFYVKC